MFVGGTGEVADLVVESLEDGEVVLDEIGDAGAGDEGGVHEGLDLVPLQAPLQELEKILVRNITLEDRRVFLFALLPDDLHLEVRVQLRYLCALAHLVTHHSSRLVPSYMDGGRLHEQDVDV